MYLIIINIYFLVSYLISFVLLLSPGVYLFLLLGWLRISKSNVVYYACYSLFVNICILSFFVPVKNSKLNKDIV